MSDPSRLKRRLRDLGARVIPALERRLDEGAGADALARWRVSLGEQGGAGRRRLFATHTFIAAALRALAGRLSSRRKLFAPEAEVFGWSDLPRADLAAALRGVAPDQGPSLAGLPGALHQALIAPKQRHGQGEYYTPAWLVDLTLEQLGVPAYLPGVLAAGASPPRLLDPACGAGAFVTRAAAALAQGLARGGMAPEQILPTVLSSVAGIDISPLSTLAARVSLLAAMGPHLPPRGRLPRLPIHCADSILAPPRGLGSFDLVVGNPPWVGWQSLTPGYRRATRALWREAGLFVHGGMDAIMGAGKKELATLMTLLVARRHLGQDGRMALVLGSTVWKTAGAGRGFRQLKLGPDGPPLGVLSVEDLGRTQAFAGASTRASVAVLQKGTTTRYPVPYRLRLGGDRWLDLDAEPVDRADPASPWLTAPRRLMPALRRVVGGGHEPAYRARAGACTWANGVFWLEVLEASPGGTLLVRNVTRGARRKVPQVTAELEPDLVYPLLRGRDVGPDGGTPSLSILLTQDPQTRRGLCPERMSRDLPLTWAYLQRFERVLRGRAGFRRYFTRRGKGGATVETGPFYSLFNVGPYTLSPWKVVWREQSTRLTAAAVGPVGGRPVIPDHKLMLVPCGSEGEAAYLAAMLNSVPATLAVRAFAVQVQQSTHVLRYLGVPRYDPDDPGHRARDWQSVWALTDREVAEMTEVLALLHLGKARSRG